MVAPGEWIAASGEWVNDRTHGQQFKTRFIRTAAPSSVEGIEKYLGSGMIRGIGPVYARKLIRAKRPDGLFLRLQFQVEPESLGENLEILLARQPGGEVTRLARPDIAQIYTGESGEGAAGHSVSSCRQISRCGTGYPALFFATAFPVLSGCPSGRSGHRSINPRGSGQRFW